MAKYFVEDTSLTAIADAIRCKTGGTEKLTLDQMPTEISNIGVGGNEIPAELVDGTLQSAKIADGATKIRAYAFYKCEELVDVDIPDSVTEIGIQPFWGCSSLKSLVIPDSVESISIASFTSGMCADCTSLESVVIGANVQTMQGPHFYGCSALKSVTFRGTTALTTNSGAYPFYGCTTITDIYVPWAEGEISGAPWGATNATVHYDQTVE